MTLIVSVGPPTTLMIIGQPFSIDRGREIEDEEEAEDAEALSAKVGQGSLPAFVIEQPRTRSPLCRSLSAGRQSNVCWGRS